MIRGGRHLGDRPLFPSNASGCSAEDVLLAFVEQHYLDHPVPAKVLVGPACDAVRMALEEILEQAPAVVAPRYAAEKAWMEMAEGNARLALANRARDSGRAELRLEALREALRMEDLPMRIECFDISHTMGEAAVASCVVSEGGAMKKSEYRRYNIAGITPGDDYAAMRQALTRRYEKVAMGEGVRPDLVLIDGGRGQLGIAVEVMAELGLESIPLVGVAKGEGRKPGLETLFFADGRAAANLATDQPALHLVQEIRDEAHRFAITGHRARRAKARGSSKLEDIPGSVPAAAAACSAHSEDSMACARRPWMISAASRGSAESLPNRYTMRCIDGGFAVVGLRAHSCSSTSPIPHLGAHCADTDLRRRLYLP